MAYRPKMTKQDISLLWERWHAGDSMSDIARLVHKAPASVFGHLRQYGGIEPRARQRSARHLSQDEREEISIGLGQARSLRSIARQLGRSASTISREVVRNGGIRRYRAIAAERRALHSGLRPKPCKLAGIPALRVCITNKLKRNWSPEQISGWLKTEFDGDGSMQISHETIYKSLFIQARGLLKKELQSHLRRGRKFRHSCNGNRARMRGVIIDGVSISERPAEVDDRALPGHWEGDLISGSDNTHIATIVERASRFVVLAKVQGKDTGSVVRALIREMKKLPIEVRNTLTWDRGMELATHKTFTLATDMDVYFCDPRSPWQRGSNENTNGLLRQYFPKGTNLSVHSQAKLNRVARELNARPRKTLAYSSPAVKLTELLR